MVDESHDHQRRALTRSTLVFSAATLCSRILGYVRDAMNASLFGAGVISDAFYVAYRFPNMLRDLLAEGALSNAFVSTISQYLSRGERRRALELTSVLFTLVLGVCTVVVCLGVLIAPWLIEVMAPGQYQVAGELTVRLTRWLFPFIGLIGSAAVVMGFLNANGRFTVSAFAPAMLNVVMIATGMWWCPLAGPRPEDQVFVWTLGTLVGALAQLLIQIPAAWKLGFRFRLVWDPAHAGIAQIRRLMGPMVFANSVNYINILLVNTYLASLYGQGVITYLNCGFRLLQLPMGLFGVAVASVALPTLSFQVAKGDHEGFGRTLTYALRSMFFWVVPAAIGLAVLSQPITVALFQRGRFGPEDALKTAAVTVWYAGGLLGLAGAKVITQGFYAVGNTRTPVFVALATVGVNVILSLVLGMVFTSIGLQGFYALPAANALAALFNFSVLWWRFHQGAFSLETGEVQRALMKIMGAAACMGVASWWAAGLMISAVGQVAVGIGAGVAVYVGMAWIMKIPELGEAWDAVRHRRDPAKGGS